MKNYLVGFVEKFKGLSLQRKVFLGIISTVCLGFLLFSTVKNIMNQSALGQIEHVQKKRVNPIAEIYPSKIANVRQVSPNELLQFRKKAISAGYQRNYQGYVSIPQIGMYLPILNGVNMYTLSLGAVSYYPTTRKMGDLGNYVLAGHNMDTYQNVLFSRLPNVSVGKESKIILTDGIKNYYYHVTSKRIVSPKQPVQKDGKPDRGSILYNDNEKREVTLFTCNYNGSRRIVVQGEYDYSTSH